MPILMVSLYIKGLHANQAQTLSPKRKRPEDSFLLNSSRLNFLIRPGKGILMGQTSSHLPQKVDAFGECRAAFKPIRLGVSTAPTGPG